MINQLIDHTKLGFSVTNEQIDKLCQEAIEYQFKSVCVNPIYVKRSSSNLKDTNVLVCTVIGFPHGTHLLETKVFETKQALKDGADEFDLVINIANLKNNNDDLVLDEIKTIKEVIGDKTLKVIIETSVLSSEEIARVSKIVVKAGANFVKTSTGYGVYGARLEDVKIMLDSVGTKAEVKASGGVRNFVDAKKYIDLGVTRIGTSNGIDIITKKEKNNDSNTSY